MKLVNQSKNIVLLQKIELANSFKKRFFGLMGQSLTQNDCLWIHKCNWIHTFFMKSSIDVIYVNKKLIVEKIDFEIKPWRFAKPVCGAASVFELKAGNLKPSIIDIGDQLYVGH